MWRRLVWYKFRRNLCLQAKQADAGWMLRLLMDSEDGGG
jgi:hypothetical protein